MLPKTYSDFNGEPVDVEEPARFMTSDAKVDLGDLVTDAAWSRLSEAFRSPLFGAPVRHFFVRAYHAQGIDEFMAHLTAIEAALGLQSDYGRKPKGDPRSKLRATEIMAQRVSAILGDEAAALEYEELFDLRSAYVHGRPMAPISSVDRFRARRLARRVVLALVKKALSTGQGIPLDREQLLIALKVNGRQDASA